MSKYYLKAEDTTFLQLMYSKYWFEQFFRPVFHVLFLPEVCYEYYFADEMPVFLSSCKYTSSKLRYVVSLAGKS